MNHKELLSVVEQYSRKVEVAEGQIKVTRVPDFKTVYIETVAGIGRSIVLAEYKVDGKTYWAGYSSISGTVFVSQTSSS